MVNQTKIGYACINLNILPSGFKTCRVSTYEANSFRDIVDYNLKLLHRHLTYNIESGLGLYRISSEIIPLATHPVMTVPWEIIFSEELQKLGQLITENGIRVSMHVSHYTILNSPSEDIVTNSLKDIEYHNRLLTTMGLDTTHKIIIHVGGVYGEKELSLERFINHYHRLSDGAQNRLVVENDEKNYGLEDVLRLSDQCHIPVVYDIFHENCYCKETIDIQKNLLNACATWKKEDGTPKIHYSEQDPKKRRGAHAITIQTETFLQFYEQVKALNIDIMIEAKSKNIAAMKAKNLMHTGSKREIDKIIRREWARYKYVIMSHGYQYYKDVQAFIKSDGSLREFYVLLDQIMETEKPESAVYNTLLHVWGYYKEIAREQEKKHFLTTLDSPDHYERAKAYLLKLTEKYRDPYLSDSYTFYL